MEFDIITVLCTITMNNIWLNIIDVYDESEVKRTHRHTLCGIHCAYQKLSQAIFAKNGVPTSDILSTFTGTQALRMLHESSRLIMSYARCEVSRAVKIHIVVFRVMTPCGLVGGYRRFCLQFNFYPKEGGSMLLRIAGTQHRRSQKFSLYVIS
jgi:hypothetical protein